MPLTLTSEQAAVALEIDALLHDALEGGVTDGSVGIYPPMEQYDTLDSAIQDTVRQSFDSALSVAVALLLTPPATEVWRVVGASGQPAFAHGWSASNGGYAPPSFYKDGDTVHLRGRVRFGTSGSHAFQLPTGYRPSFLLDFAASGATASKVTVATNGNVTPVGSSSGISLDGISFRIG